MITKPLLTDVPQPYQKYIDQITEKDLITALQNEMKMAAALMETIPLEKESYTYADQKWTLKQVIAHIIDIEKIFSYRAL